MVDTGVKGVQLFRVTAPIHCAPAVYEPSVVAILSGAKEALLDGTRHLYDASQYLCCTLSMPVEAGAPEASPENPLLGGVHRSAYARDDRTGDQHGERPGPRPPAWR